MERKITASADAVIGCLLFRDGALAGLATAASADVISYNTTGSTLSCNGVSGCVQDSTTSVTVGGLTLTYNIGSGSGEAIALNEIYALTIGDLTAKARTLGPNSTAATKLLPLVP